MDRYLRLVIEMFMNRYPSVTVAILMCRNITSVIDMFMDRFEMSMDRYVILIISMSVYRNTRSIIVMSVNRYNEVYGSKHKARNCNVCRSKSEANNRNAYVSNPLVSWPQPLSVSMSACPGCSTSSIPLGLFLHRPLYFSCQGHLSDNSTPPKGNIGEHKMCGAFLCRGKCSFIFEHQTF
jgi:hypothetical protein